MLSKTHSLSKNSYSTMSESGDANTEEPPRPSGQAEGEPPVGVAPLEGAATAGGHHDDDNEHSKQHKKKRKHRDRDDSRERKRKSKDPDRSDDEKSKMRERAADGLTDGPAETDSKGSRHRQQSDSARGRDRGRDRDRDRDRDRNRDRDRGRDRDRDRRERSGSRRRRRHSRSPSRRRRDRSSSPRRHRSSRRSRSADRGHRDSRGGADRRRDRSASSGRKEKKRSASPERTLPTLKEIISSNPGISVADAVQRLNMLNMQLQQAALAGGAPGGVSSVPLLALSAGVAPNGVGVLSSAGGALTKQQREIYVGNLPPGVSIPQITDFVNCAMRQLGVTPGAPVGSVASAWVSGDGHYAFVELRTIDEANTAMAYLSGLQIGPFSLKVGRPKASGPSGLTVPMAATPFTAHMLGLGPSPGGVPLLGGFPMPPITTTAAQLGGLASAMGSAVAGMPGDFHATDSESKVVMATNIPLSLSEHQIKELMSPFGEIKCFNIIPDALGVAKSHTAVLEYETKEAANAAVSGLSGILFGELKLSLQCVPQSMAALLLQPSNKPSQVQDSELPPVFEVPPTAALQLSNMVSEEDLRDEELYAELLEDVADECNSHGTVRSIVIPRPVDSATAGDYSVNDKHAGVGKIFVLFLDNVGADEARKAVNGRSFNGRTVEAVFFPEDLLGKKIYTIPSDYRLAGSDENCSDNAPPRGAEHTIPDEPLD